MAETEFALQVESDIAPYKGLLMGLFFMTVGMEISVGLFFAEWKTVVSGIVLLIGGKVTFIYLERPIFCILFTLAVMMCANICADACTDCLLLCWNLMHWAFVLVADRLFYSKVFQHFGVIWLCLTAADMKGVSVVFDADGLYIRLEDQVCTVHQSQTQQTHP